MLKYFKNEHSKNEQFKNERKEKGQNGQYRICT